jgi:hypothetical protein
MAALIRAAAARAGPFRYFIVEAPDRFTGVDHVDSRLRKMLIRRELRGISA